MEFKNEVEGWVRRVEYKDGVQEWSRRVEYRAVLEG